jgi:hypothetical protein
MMADEGHAAATWHISEQTAVAATLLLQQLPHAQQAADASCPKHLQYFNSEQHRRFGGLCTRSQMLDGTM